MRILIILPCLPFPAYNGQTHRLALVTRSLAERHEVALACLTEPGQNAALPETDRALFTDVRLASRSPMAEGMAHALRRRLSPDPSDVHAYHSPALRRGVTELAAALRPELVLIGDPALIGYAELLPGLPVALDYVCEFTLQFERMGALAPPLERPLWAMRRSKYARFLSRIEKQVDAAFLNSREDVDSLARLWPARKLLHVANGLDLAAYPTGLAEPQSGRLIFPGSIAYPPNRDAVAWFGEAIWPAIRARRPDAELRVTGQTPTDADIPRFPGLVYTGRVPDVRIEIASAMATVVPLRLGAGGARFKVIESMALGAALVGTTIGIEGLDLEDGVDHLHADAPDAFAAACLRLLEDDGLRRRIGAGARRRMEESYDWRVLFARLEERLEELRAGAARPRHPVAV